MVGRFACGGYAGEPPDRGGAPFPFSHHPSEQSSLARATPTRRVSPRRGVGGGARPGPGGGMGQDVKKNSGRPAGSGAPLRLSCLVMFVGSLDPVPEITALTYLQSLS